MLTALLLLHVALALVAAATGRRLGRAVFALTGAAPLATTVWAAAAAPEILSGQAVTERWAWVPTAGLELSFRVDAFTLLMVALVSGVGVLVFAYSFAYFLPAPPDLGRFSSTLLAFSGSMLGLVTADNVLALFTFWELTSVTSYLLIGYKDASEKARDAALQALLVTGGGGLVLLAGLVLLGQAAGDWSISGIAEAQPSGPLVTAAAWCVLVGVATKSAQVPFHFWLPGAMVAPTPVSAYLHSATMVKAGVFLAARLSPALTAGTSVWRPAVVTLGVVTMLVGGWRALREYDLKLLLAYGTVSQLGLLMALLGAGAESAAFAGAALLLAHGLFKAGLFMVVGVIDHETGTRDLRRLSGLRRTLPRLAVASAVCAASMAGLPPLLGFLAKEEALAALAEHGLGAGGPVWLTGVVAGSILTFAYSARFWWGAFGDRPGRAAATAAHRPSAIFVAPAAVTAVLSLLLGVVPGLASRLVEQATVALVPGARPHPLALWHGLGLPVALTAVVFTAGTALALRLRTMRRTPRTTLGLPDAAGLYRATLRGMQRVAGRTTAIMQSGSLPTYAAVILTAAVLAPAARLLPLATEARPARLIDSPWQLLAAAGVVAGAFGVIRSRRRFGAVLALGSVGYAIVILFALHGAPDLALTQLLIETLSIVAFAIALRHLPDRFELHPWRVSQWVRGLVSVTVGVFVAGLALIAGSQRRLPGVSAEHLARAYPEGGGRNVVNVILVDFRGLDTLGEITVLAVAAVGVAALVLVRPERGLLREPDDEEAN